MADTQAAVHTHSRLAGSGAQLRQPTCESVGMLDDHSKHYLQRAKQVLMGGCQACAKGPEWLGLDVGVVKPTRHGRLPTGDDDFNRGKAAAMLVHRKVCRYGRLMHMFALRKPVDFKALGFEVAGGMGAKAAMMINDITNEATRNKVKLSHSDWSWSAQSFSAYWLMRLSFVISKLTALSVHRGVRRAMAASAAI